MVRMGLLFMSMLWLQKTRLLRKMETRGQVSVTCNSDTLLICINNISSNEQPTVEWNFLGKLLAEDDRCRMQIQLKEEGYEATLQINEVSH